MRSRIVRRASARPFATLAITLTALLAAAGLAAAAGVDLGDPFGSHQVGEQQTGRILLPTNQWVSPAGNRITVNDGRITSSTLSPDGTKLAALTWQNFTAFVSIIDLKSGKVQQQVGTGTQGDPVIGDGTVSPDGPLYSADGHTLWVGQSADLVRFTVADDGTISAPTVIKLSGPHGAALPSGMALSADGSKLYAALNGSNTLGVIDTTTNQLVQEIPVGNAPRQVVISGGQAFVSNEGGRPATAGDFTNLSDDTPIVSDNSTGAANTGTLSVVDLAQGKQTSTIPVGLQPTAMYLNGSTLLVANSNDDSVSVVDTQSQHVTQTFSVNPLPGSKVGSYPNAITMPDPQHILVSIGRDNALAVYRYNGPVSPVQLEGLVPTDWYPVNVQFSGALGQLVVTNDKGIGARGPASTIDKGPGTSPAIGHNTYDDTGTVTTFATPSTSDLGQYTHQVFANNGWDRLLAAGEAPSGGHASAIPRRLGDPSPIKHVFLIVKENRTYDQVLGDAGKGNSDPSLTQFGQNVTPNLHALAKRYTLFDNFYDEGTLSADGHNWLVQADANDYIEKEFGAFFRSYPAQGGDALAYQRDGFLWNAAAKDGKTSADWGEYANFFDVPATGAPTWTDWYHDSQVLEGKASGPLHTPIGAYPTHADIPSLNAIMNHAYPRFDLNVPDQYRVDIWLRDFKQAEQTGNLANLNMLWVPDDHTSGLNSGDPYPTAQVADNDLAVGRIVDEISHSRFWKSSAIFVLEDDPQDGADHVDGHRSPLWIASPYAKRGVVDSQYFTQLNVVKTIEQILGIQPMNQEDRAAVPMSGAFTDHADPTPFSMRPNQVPLTLGVAGATFARVSRRTVRAGAAAARRPVVPLSARALYRAWAAWSAKQRFAGAGASEDLANPAQLNRLDWYTATNWARPYPGDLKLLAPNQVPDRNRPADELGDG